LAAILFSDISGYSEMMKSDQAATLGILETNRAIHTSNIARNRGHFLKEMGDGVLASFPSASEAVACARSIQRDVGSDGRYTVRIGIHLGEIVQANGDVFGDGVNLASRIHGEAEPGGIAVSEVVFDNVRNLQGISGVDLGPRSLKGFTGSFRLFGIEVGASA
jgi:class 3 adenylate cyclase